MMSEKAQKIKGGKEMRKILTTMDEVSRLSKTIQNNHYSELSTIENNMEYILNLDKGDE